jgi:hypothetical protein
MSKAWGPAGCVRVHHWQGPAPLTEEELLPGLQHVEASPEVPHQGDAGAVNGAGLSDVSGWAGGAVD